MFNNNRVDISEDQNTYNKKRKKIEEEKALHNAVLFMLTNPLLALIIKCQHIHVHTQLYII